MGGNVTVDVLRAMMGKAREKLASSKLELVNRLAGEASSRAYYAVFHALTAVLASKGLSLSSHAETLGAFNREFVKTGVFPIETTRKLQRLFEDRQMADYDWANTVDSQTASEDVAEAEGILEACEAYLLKTVQGYTGKP